MILCGHSMSTTFVPDLTGGQYKDEIKNQLQTDYIKIINDLKIEANKTTVNLNQMKDLFSLSIQQMIQSKKSFDPKLEMEIQLIEKAITNVKVTQTKDKQAQYKEPSLIVFIEKKIKKSKLTTDEKKYIISKCPSIKKYNKNDQQTFSIHNQQKKDYQKIELTEQQQIKKHNLKQKLKYLNQNLTIQSQNFCIFFNNKFQQFFKKNLKKKPLFMNKKDLLLKIKKSFIKDTTKKQTQFNEAQLESYINILNNHIDFLYERRNVEKLHSKEPYYFKKKDELVFKNFTVKKIHNWDKELNSFNRQKCIQKVPANGKRKIDNIKIKKNTIQDQIKNLQESIKVETKINENFQQKKKMEYAYKNDCFSNKLLRGECHDQKLAKNKEKYHKCCKTYESNEFPFKVQKKVQEFFNKKINEYWTNYRSIRLQKNLMLEKKTFQGFEGLFDNNN